MRKTKLVDNCDKLNNKLTIFSDEHTPFDKDKYRAVLDHLKLTHHGLSRNHIYKELIDYLSIHKLTPCIFFCFSRKKCEKLARAVSQNLCDQDEISQIHSIIQFNLRKCDNFKSYIKLEQYAILIKCLEKGVAFHHSGLLPVFKEIVEILYGKHLVKVLFATETFAVGVNMPTKTVVFTSLEKYTNDDFRYLMTHEYLQMGGRAGRRGIDKEGLVILLPNLGELPNVHVMNNLINGSSQTIQSKFTADYKLLLKTIITGNEVNNLVKSSLLNNEITKQKDSMQSEINEITLCDKDYVYALNMKNLFSHPMTFYQNTIGIKKIGKEQVKLSTQMVEDLYKEYLQVKPQFEKYNKLKNDLNTMITLMRNEKF